jgi:hypothetical protein
MTASVPGVGPRNMAEFQGGCPTSILLSAPHQHWCRMFCDQFYTHLRTMQQRLFRSGVLEIIVRFMRCVQTYAYTILRCLGNLIGHGAGSYMPF